MQEKIASCEMAFTLPSWNYRHISKVWDVHNRIIHKANVDLLYIEYVKDTTGLQIPTEQVMFNQHVLNTVF